LRAVQFDAIRRRDSRWVALCAPHEGLWPVWRLLDRCFSFCVGSARYAVTWPVLTGLLWLTTQAVTDPARACPPALHACKGCLLVSFGARMPFRALVVWRKAVFERVAPARTAHIPRCPAHRHTSSAACPQVHSPSESRALPGLCFDLFTSLRPLSGGLD